MQRLDVSGAVRPLQWPLGVKGLMFFWPCIIAKPTWCTLYSIYYELRPNTCFEHHLLILRRRFKIVRVCYVGWRHLVQPTDITRTQYIKCRLCSASWWWESNARNMSRPLILNKQNKKCITLVSLYWYTVMHGQSLYWYTVMHGQQNNKYYVLYVVFFLLGDCNQERCICGWNSNLYVLENIFCCLWFVSSLKTR
jgi:hypothetical protein